MTKVLTQRAVDAAKPKQKQYSLVDVTIPGLRCLVHPAARRFTGYRGGSTAS